MKLLGRLLIASLLVLSFSTALVNRPASAAIDLFPTSGPECKSKADGSQTVVCQQNTAQNATKENPVIRALRVTIQLMSLVVGVSALIGFIIAGLNIITSNGDSQKVAKSRSTLIYTSVALVIVGLANTIVMFVLSRID